MPKPWRLTWYDRTGKSLGAFGGAGRYLSLSLSPDEKRIAVDADSDVAPGYRIFVIDHERDTTAQLTVGNATGNFPVWSPDGRQLAFGSNREGVYNIYVKPSTGAGQEDLVLRNDRNKFLSDWSRDGRFLLYGQSAGTNHTDLWTLPMIGDHKPMLYLRRTGEMRGGCFSPDGRWVAYQSDESSRYEIYVQSFPAGAEKVQISTNGGTRPKWRADGKELYYLTLTGTLMAVPVKPGPAFAAGVPETLFQTWSSGILLGYAASRDGGRFVFLAPEEERAAEPVTVILNRP
jgi:Tol biopolymer transport system component